VSLLAYGVASRPAAPERVRFVSGSVPDEQVVLLTPEDPGEPPRVELVRLDEESRPIDSSFLTSAAGAACRIDGRLFLFSPEGATSILENRTPGRAPFVADRFTESALSDEILDAASGGAEALLAGRDATRRPEFWLFDGISFVAPLSDSESGPAAVDELAVAKEGARSYLLAARADERLHTGRVAAGRLDWIGSIPIGPGGPGLTLLFGEDGGPAVFALGGRENPEESGLLRIPLLKGGAPADPEVLAALPEVESARLLGPAGLDPPALLLEADGALRSVSARGAPEERSSSGASEEPSSWPMFLVAWAASWTRFEVPLGLQLALLMLLGLFGRWKRGVETFPGRPAEAQAPAEATFDSTGAPPEVFVPAPAGLPRRFLAFLADVAVLLLLTLICFALALHPIELEYMTFAYLEAAVRAEQAGDGVLLINAALEALLVDARLLFMMLMTGVLAFSEGSFGRSPGKLLLGLRVVRLDGGAPSLGASATRALMLLVDWFWSFGVVGLLLAGFTRRRQRLGDLLAGTMVVRAGQPSK